MSDKELMAQGRARLAAIYRAQPWVLIDRQTLVDVLISAQMRYQDHADSPIGGGLTQSNIDMAQRDADRLNDLIDALRDGLMLVEFDEWAPLAAYRFDEESGDADADS